MEKCSIKNCNREIRTNVLCGAHYARWLRHGDALQDIPIKPVGLSLEERFKDKMSEPDANGCMNWLGCTSEGRYGKLTIGSKKDGTKRAESAHRVSYELFIGKIPDGMYVLHKCDNVHCVNPDHLFIGTQMDNIQDMIMKGRDNKRRLNPVAKMF